MAFERRPSRSDEGVKVPAREPGELDLGEPQSHASELISTGQECVDSFQKLVQKQRLIMDLRSQIDRQRQSLFRFQRSLRLHSFSEGMFSLESVAPNEAPQSGQRLSGLMSEIEGFFNQLESMQNVERDLIKVEDLYLGEGEIFVNRVSAFTLALKGWHLNTSLLQPTLQEDRISNGASSSSLSDYPRIVREYWDKVGDLPNLREYLTDIDMEHAEDRNDRNFKEDQDAILEISDAEFEQIYNSKRQQVLDDIEETQKEAEKLRALCITEGWNLEDPKEIKRKFAAANYEVSPNTAMATSRRQPEFRASQSEPVGKDQETLLRSSLSRLVYEEPSTSSYGEFPGMARAEINHWINRVPTDVEFNPNGGSSSASLHRDPLSSHIQT